VAKWVQIYQFATGSSSGGGSALGLGQLAIGPKGEPGSAILTGDAPPAASLGRPGDLFVQSNGNIYHKESPNPLWPAFWLLKANITGPAGKNGQAGAPGRPGDPGPAGASGTGGGGGTGGNPTALVGLTAVNGAASTFIRSDGAPAMDQSITPTWTGAHIFNSTVYVNLNSTSAFIVEQSGVYADVLHVDTNHPGVSIGNAISTSALLYIGGYVPATAPTGGNAKGVTLGLAAGGDGAGSGSINRGGIGGQLTVNLGNGGNATSVAAVENLAGTGGSFTLVAGNGGNASNSSFSNNAGGGGNIYLQAGAPGTGTVASTYGFIALSITGSLPSSSGAGVLTLAYDGTNSIQVDATGISFFTAATVPQQTGDAGTALVTFGLMTGTPTFDYANLTGLAFDDFADAGNTTTGETDLYTHTTAAGSLATNGDKWKWTISGTTAANPTATRRLRVYFGGGLIYDSTPQATPGTSNDWQILVTIIRESSTVVRCITAITDFLNLSTWRGAKYTRVTGLTLSSTNIIKITGQSSNTTNDIVATLGVLRWERHA
jgi:hypothetical protein